jgi:hypothetical protein
MLHAQNFRKGARVQWVETFVARALHPTKEDDVAAGARRRPEARSNPNVVPMAGVMERIDFLLRFWELRARSERLGDPLEPGEQLELLSLMQLVIGPRVQGAGPVARDQECIPAQVIGDGAIQPIEIRTVSARAILVAAATALEVGAQVIVRIADAVTGVEFALPCEVTWAYQGAPCTMALAVDGIPTRTDFIAPSAASTALRMGPRRRLVG